MDNAIWLRHEAPESHKVIDLAPRVKGEGEHVGGYGYALEITNRGIRVLWDDSRAGVEEVHPNSITFITPKPTSL